MTTKHPQTQVIDIQTGQVLFSCPIEDNSQAYQFAAEMDALGLDVKVCSPSLSETLGESLGLNREKMKKLKDSIHEEIENHDGSCCFEDKPKSVN